MHCPPSYERHGTAAVSAGPAGTGQANTKARQTRVIAKDTEASGESDTHKDDQICWLSPANLFIAAQLQSSGWIIIWDDRNSNEAELLISVQRPD